MRYLLAFLPLVGGIREQEIQGFLTPLKRWAKETDPG